MLIENLEHLFRKMPKRRKWQMAMVSSLMLVGAVAEVATLGAVIPFLAILSGSDATSCKVPFLPCHISLAEASFIFASVAIVATLIKVVLLYVSNRFTYALGADIGNEIYMRVLFQPYQYHVAHNTSVTIGGVNKVNLLVQQVINPLVQSIVSLVMGMGIFIALLYVDATAAVAATIVFGLLYLAASILSHKMLRTNSQIIAERENKRIQAIQEGLGGIRDIIIDNAQTQYARRFGQLNAQQRKAGATNAFIRIVPRHVIEGLGMLSMVAVAWWISQLNSLADAIPVLGAMALGAQKLLPQLQQVYAASASIRGSEAVLRDVLVLLDNKIPREHSNNIGVTKSTGKSTDQNIPIIAIRGLSFSYIPHREEVLSAVDLCINQGERIGFIGTTGSGKSTLLDLIMGLLEPTSGFIEVEGEKLSSQNMRSWRSRIAHVPQAIYLSDATLAENIAFGREYSKIDFECIEMAAKKAQLADFIDGLPSRYHTKVGERGVQLSGGQRQRIGLARAFYKQADLLILDEATSALDDKTEDAIMQSIGNLDRDLTILMIAHRISTLSKCDRIVELDSGQIKRICKYQELRREEIS